MHRAYGFRKSLRWGIRCLAEVRSAGAGGAGEQAKDNLQKHVDDGRLSAGGV